MLLGVTSCVEMVIDGLNQKKSCKTVGMFVLKVGPGLALHMYILQILK
jgi:hypothetical protein